MGEYHPGVILVWCVIASSGDYISRWSLMRRADGIIIETIIHYIQTAYVHAIMSRTTVAGECLLNIIHHTTARGLGWICFTMYRSTYSCQGPKLNMYHNSATHPYLPAMVVHAPPHLAWPMLSHSKKTSPMLDYPCWTFPASNNDYLVLTNYSCC